MEYKYKLIPLLRYSSLVVLLFLAISTQAGHNTYNIENSNNNLDSSIYYGDSEVYVGHPFAITCMVSITDSIQWYKDDELIKKHNNIRHHGKDEHFYIETQNDVEGESDKITSTISVQRALPKHEGIYRCNEHHSNYHTLRVKKSNVYSKKEKFYKIVEHSEPFLLQKKLDEEFLSNEYLYDLAKIAAESVATTAAEQLIDQQHNHHHRQPQDDVESDEDEERELISQRNQEGASGENVEITEDSVPNYSETPTHDNTSLVFDLVNENLTDDDEDDGKATDDDVDLGKTLEGTYIITEILATTTTTTTTTTEVEPTTTTTTESPTTTALVVKYTDSLDNAGGSVVNQKDLLHKHDSKTNNVKEAKNNKKGMKQDVVPVETNIPKNIVTAAPPPTTAIVEVFVKKHKVVDKIDTKSKMIKLNQVTLEPNYDFKGDSIKIYDIRSPLILSCQVTPASDDMKWYKGNVEVSKESSLTDRHKVIKAENKFIIDKTNEGDAGTYSCKVGETSKDIIVIAKVAVKLPSSTAVVEGEKLSIQCLVVGTDPQLKWSIGAENATIIDGDDVGRIKLEADSDGRENAVLVIDSAVLEDRNTYRCMASNKATDLLQKGDAESKTEVRVKGKLAALWPFLGICAEVFVLCAIILIYEKRRNRADPEESDTDQSPDQKNEHQGKETDVRQRK